ncbi:ABC transporter ATP-binding protein/permease [Aerococcus urinaeequi]|uniref:Sulfate ABC transporter ATP-binding protein n=1 Tax=Aerococcus viridans TaxID=1377 RepID=A0A2N6UBL8_9LACT|nr:MULTISPECIES: ABC transporter ATP-binding protein/permease [Aerococcus]OFU50160.1 sulfate ABC transporter ATP-binding protein [Aerococcus sp. HMSC10H05]PMC78946.1 sulfate ABC transporter ATP-binding protein [Aerococcus viridans]
MLELKNLRKTYQVGETVTHALNDVSLAFRKQEFVAILGPSGSGKTTLLNVIGGLDRYDSGDMVINGQSTKNFKDLDWDAYRNNSIGFIFQSYNIISHLDVLSNVELGMTLSGVAKEEKREKAKRALIRVGLEDHIHKQPNQLSGGQMQRVAIARALANDPDVLLCDEPTGALDSETGQQIMDLIQDLSTEKLVIMVTHDGELANQYADRIINFKDGKVINDSNAYDNEDVGATLDMRRTGMSYLTALNLSFKNIMTKKGRTFITSFASSIGIISIAVVLSLSNGFQKQIDSTQAETSAQFPVTISQVAQDTSNFTTSSEEETEYPSEDIVIANEDPASAGQHENDITDDLVQYVNDIDPQLIEALNYTYSAQLNLLRDVDGEVQQVAFSNYDQDSATSDIQSFYATSSGMGASTFPEATSGNENAFFSENYDVLQGELPTEETDLVLVVDEYNKVNINALNNLGFDYENGDEIAFDDIIGTEVVLAANDAYYQKLPSGTFIPNQDLNDVYNNDNNQTLRVSAVIRPKEDATMAILTEGINYSNALTESIIKSNQDSAIVQAQNDSDHSVLTGETLDDAGKEQVLTALGANPIPSSIMIYPKNFETKDEVLSYLDAYNEGKSEDEKVLYTDLAGTVTELTGGIMNATTYVLVAFAAISLVTSMIMIGIITYTSVLERTKEIGVLKALGARKKDITRVFDSETLILGFLSGLIGVGTAYLLTFPINILIESLTDLKNVAVLDPVHAVTLLIISTILTVLGGHIPARIAAKKDAAEALRAD